MKTLLITLGLLTVGFHAWPFLRVGTYWALTLALVSAFGIIGFLKMKEYAAAIMWSSAIFDACKISGLVTIPDYPPVYFFNVFSLLALTIIAGNRGGFSTIAMASVAYRRFKRDILLSAIKETLRMEASSETSKKIYELSQLLPDIANLTHAGRVSITVNLPLGRPIIQTYDRDANSTTIHDDGKIPGAVTLRTLVYGDTAIFESFDQFTKKLKLTPNPELQDSRIFCALPLSVDNTIIGSMMFTKFNDDYLEGARLRGGDLAEERENLTVLVTTLSQSLSSLMVRDLNSYSIISKSLHKAVHREIALANNSEDFLHRYANCLAEACSAQVIIHGRVKDQGIALAHSGLPDDAWNFFCENPLNLNPDSASSFGPTVVAFIDGRSNFIKDIGEIWDRLHPKTQLVFARVNVRGIAAVPLLSSESFFVATIVKTKDESYVDPTIVQVIESTEVLFTAAIEVMSQKSSVLALGELTSRLIGDADVRNKIIAAAKAQKLPTTIGSPKTSFLLLFDLAGSSDLSEDTEIKARAYGRFYDAVNTKSQDLLNGSIRKTIGDAIIITWDGSTTTPSDEPNFLEKLEFLTHYADSIARSIGCKGSRALLHYGSYFLGLVGTKTFGQIDVIGSGIDEVCKMEGLMKGIAIDGFPIKLAISERAVSELTTILLNEYTDRNYQIIENSDHAKLKLHFAKTLSHKLEVKRDVA
jgi:class 3 adenylate cyclase